VVKKDSAEKSQRTKSIPGKNRAREVGRPGRRNPIGSLLARRASWSLGDKAVRAPEHVEFWLFSTECSPEDTNDKGRSEVAGKTKAGSRGSHNQGGDSCQQPGLTGRKRGPWGIGH
jgi:hypothetical protein